MALLGDCSPYYTYHGSSGEYLNVSFMPAHKEKKGFYFCQDCVSEFETQIWHDSSCRSKGSQLIAKGNRIVYVIGPKWDGTGSLFSQKMIGEIKRRAANADRLFMNGIIRSRSSTV